MFDLDLRVSVHAGHMFFFGYSNAKPHVQYKVADEKGAITHNVAFNLREPIMMHDFAVTQDYAIFLDVPLFFRAQVQLVRALSEDDMTQNNTPLTALIDAGMYPVRALDADEC